jgi:hypothetical protein
VKTKPTAKLVELVANIQQSVETTNPQFAENFESDLNTHPIPYFGRLESAEVLTVGLNPSPGEFRNGRWPRQPLEAELLACKLHDYFQCNDFSSHPWFEKWSAAISKLDRGWQYQTGQIAHVDLSPRATSVASQVPKSDVFAKMIQHDLQWLPDLLECAKSA